tara:strand:+ start:42 stop:308 length:267 start_codon:yes stop_codon:yes gene_type:complete
MKIFVYKSLFVFFLILILFKLTIGELVSNYEKKMDLILSKESLKEVENKIREEVKAGIEKERILDPNDALLLSKFFKKIQKEISEIDN